MKDSTDMSMRCYHAASSGFKCIETTSTTLTSVGNQTVPMTHVKLYSYTFIACIVALVQLLFLVGACFYVKVLKERNKKRLAMDQAQYYRLFYQLH